MCMYNGTFLYIRLVNIEGAHGSMGSNQTNELPYFKSKLALKVTN